jgi:hypothetical protein
VKQALLAIETACPEVVAVKRGVYVISLSSPLSIGYRYGPSQVIYIGIGNIMGRIKTHFNDKLFDFMLSLSGANFDFWFARPARQGTAEYFKHVEYLMLEWFSDQYGGLNDERRFPILNKNAGADKDLKRGSIWWKKPLKATGKWPRWELKPTKFSRFAALDD